MHIKKNLYLAINLSDMKKVLLSILMICSMNCINNLFAQCSPDTSFKTSGTLPAALDTARIGVPYSQVLQYHITKDTTIYVAQLGQTVNAKIDTLWITGVKGMPAGFTYDCHNADCKIMGGKTGCATLKGTPNAGQGGIYPLVVLIRIRATAFLGPVPVAQTVNDSNSRYTIVVQGANGVGQLSETSEPILYPNPAKSELQVYVPELNEKASYMILNLQGLVVQKGAFSDPKEVNHLTLNAFESGVYFIEIKTEEKVWLKKFIVE